MNKDEAEMVIRDTIDHADKEIKKTKKKLRRILLIIALVIAAIPVFFALKPVSFRYSESDLYSKEDLKSAMECVKEDFKSFHGCKLFSLQYNGDSKTLRETEDRMNHDPQYDEYIVVDSVFLSPLFGLGAWNNREIYTYSWILGRNTDGEWVVISKGY